MKKVVVILSLILMIVLLAPKFIGDYVKQERAEFVALINANEAVTLVTDSYQPSWFGAEVNSSLSVFIDENKATKVDVKLIENMSFGPIMVTDRGWFLGLGYSSVALNFEGTDDNQELIDLINNKIHLGALLSFNKKLTSFISTDAMRYENSEETLIAGASSATFTVFDQKHIVGDFSWTGLTLADTEQRFVLENVTFSTEQSVVSGEYVKGNAILTGDSHFGIQKVDMYHENNHQLSLSAITFANSLSLADDLLRLTVNLNAKEVSVAGQNYQQPNVAITFDNLDFTALQSLNSTLSTLSPTLTEEETTTKILGALSSLADQMLAKQPVLKVTDLSVETEQGKVVSDFTFMLEQDQFDHTNLTLMSLLVALNAEANANVPMALVTKYGVTAMVDNFVQQGYLKKTDDVVGVKAVYQQSQLSLNGKAFQF